MRSWVFRNRQRLEAIYGHATAPLDVAPAARGVPDDAAPRLRVLVLVPRPRRNRPSGGR
jgi:hypothetical protein